MTREEELTLFEQTRRLVPYILRHLEGREDYEDVLQEGYIGLLLAIRSYPGDSPQFARSTWLGNHIRWRVIRYFKRSKTLKRGWGAGETLSLDAALDVLNDPEGATLHDVVADPREDPAAEAEARIVAAQVRALAETPRERLLVAGLAEAEGCRSLAVRLGLSHEMARQEANAFRLKVRSQVGRKPRQDARGEARTNAQPEGRRRWTAAAAAAPWRALGDESAAGPGQGDARPPRARSRRPRGSRRGGRPGAPGLARWGRADSRSMTRGANTYRFSRR